MYLHTYVLYKDVFPRVNKGTYAFLHTEPFPQRNLCTEQFLHMFFLKHLTQKNLYTQNAYISFYRPIFLHAKNYPNSFYTAETFSHRNLYAQKKICTTIFKNRWFLHRKFSAQKSCAQKVLNTTFFTFTHKCLYTDTNCTQKHVHTARVYTQPTFTQRGFASPS